MIDFKALCAELTDDLEAWVEGYLINDYPDECTAESLERIDRARAALAAEPEPPADGEVARMVAWLRMQGEAQKPGPNSLLSDRTKKEHHAAGVKLIRAADLLERLASQPVQEGPTVMENIALSDELGDCGNVDFARRRAVFARWGRP